MKKLTERQVLLNTIPYWFLSFLIKEKVLSLWASNVLKRNSLRGKDLLHGENVKNSFINECFTWAFTPEGQNFWDDVCKKEAELRQSLELPYDEYWITGEI